MSVDIDWNSTDEPKVGPVYSLQKSPELHLEVYPLRITLQETLEISNKISDTLPPQRTPERYFKINPVRWFAENTPKYYIGLSMYVFSNHVVVFENTEKDENCDAMYSNWTSIL